MYPLSLAIAISTSELWEEVSSCLQQLPVRVVYEQAGVEDPASFLEKIERSAPDVVLLDVRNSSETLPELIRQIRSCSSQPEVVAVSATSNPEEILGAIRAGAREFVYPPCTPSLQQALERLSGERQKTAETTRPGGRTVGVVSAKGGLRRNHAGLPRGHGDPSADEPRHAHHGPGSLGRAGALLHQDQLQVFDPGCVQ